MYSIVLLCASGSMGFSGWNTASPGSVLRAALLTVLYRIMRYIAVFFCWWPTMGRRLRKFVERLGAAGREAVEYFIRTGTLYPGIDWAEQN